MNKQDMAQYLVNLIAIMESKEDSGRSKGQGLAREYERVYATLRDTITKEEEDEARTRDEFENGKHEAGADIKSSESRRG